MTGKAPDTLLAGLMEPVHADNQGTSLFRRDLLHQKRGAGTALIGILPYKTVPQIAFNVLVIRDDGKLLFREFPQEGIDCLRCDTSQRQSLHAAVQQPLQCRQIGIGVSRRCEFRQRLHAVLLGIGNAAIDALHDLGLKVRLTEGDQDADLVLFSGEIEGPAQGVGLEIHLLHDGPDLFRRLRLDLPPVVEDPVHGPPGYARFFGNRLNGGHGSLPLLSIVQCGVYIAVNVHEIVIKRKAKHFRPEIYLVKFSIILVEAVFNCHI